MLKIISGTLEPLSADIAKEDEDESVVGWPFSKISGDGEQPEIYLGCQDRAIDVFRKKMTHVVNATPDVENHFEDIGTIKYLRVPIEDTLKDDILTWIPVVNQFVESAGPDARVFFHCHAGISRSPSFVIAYYMSKGMSFEDAFKKIRLVRKFAWPNQSFVGQLREYETRLKVAPK